MTDSQEYTACVEFPGGSDLPKRLPEYILAACKQMALTEKEGNLSINWDRITIKMHFIDTANSTTLVTEKPPHYRLQWWFWARKLDGEADAK